MAKPNRACEVCQKPFYASPGHIKSGWGKYCSKSCNALAKTGKNNPRWGGDVEGNCKCKTCGKEFRIRPSRKLNGDGIYCSLTCKKQSYPLKHSFTCQYCSKVFEVHNCHINRQEEYKFCSIECRIDYNKSRENCACIVCGKLFYIKECELARTTKKGVGKFCSMRCKSKWMSNHAQSTGKGKGRGGKRADLNNLFVRSSWEANYARYLNWLVSLGEIKSWAYEVDTFEFFKIKKGTRFYTPDFKITNTDNTIEYHEVKGWMDQESATKLKRMSKYYPLIKIVLIDKDVYYAISKQVKNLIPNWESA